MKTRLIILGLIALPALTFAMSRGANELNGTYNNVHEIEVTAANGKDSQSEQANDTLKISNDTGSAFDFHAKLIFSYFDSCEVKGSALLKERNMTGSEWYFTYEQPKNEVKNSRCVLKFAVNSERIKLIDPDTSCKDMCGAHGFLDQAEFPRQESGYIEGSE